MASQDNYAFEGTVVDFLCEHFCGETGKGLGWVFRAAPPHGDISPDEFFGPMGFLPAFVQIAIKSGSQVGFDCSGFLIEDDPEALFGSVAKVVADPQGVGLALVIDSVERLCGPAISGRVINYEKLYNFLTANDRTDHEHEGLLSCFE